MFRKFARPAVLAVAAGLMVGGTGRAAETIRLGGKVSANAFGGAASTVTDGGGTVQRLDRRADDDNEADTQKVWHRGGWGGFHGGWGGYRGFGWGGYRGIGWGGWGRGWGGWGGWGWGRGWGGWGRGWGGWGWGGWYRPSLYIGIGSYPYWGGGWGGYGYSYPYYSGYSYPLYTSVYSSYSYPLYSYSYPVYSTYYSSPIVYGSYGAICPIGGTTTTAGTALTLEARPQQTMPLASDYTQSTLPSVQSAPQPMPRATDYARERVTAPQQATRPVPPPPAPSDGTFPYDGGPAKPVPVPAAPNVDIPPAKQPSAPAVPSERMVSLPTKKTYAYPAYGDHKSTAKPSDDTIYVKATRTQTR